MQAISSGDQLWNAASKVPLDDLKLSPATYDLVKRGLFLEPVPGVARVVFVCTPHRGSYVAGRNFIANTVRKLLTLPFALAGAASELATNQNLARAGMSPVVPSAVDNMSPRHHFIKALQKIPVAPNITVNSIIAVEGDGPIEVGNDGVVEYSSAHIEPVESETGREVEPLAAGAARDHRGDPPDSPAAHRAEDRGAGPRPPADRRPAWPRVECGQPPRRPASWASSRASRSDTRA